MIKTDRIEYMMINESLVDREFAEKNLHILHENVFNTPSGKLVTVTFDIPVTVFGKKNFNGRVYDHDIVMNAWNNNVLLQNDIKGGPGNTGKSNLCGEYQHPEIQSGAANNGLARQMTISPQFASHTIDKYWEKDGVLYNQWTTLAGGWGDVMRDRIFTGFPAMGSTRSVGGVDARGHVLPGLILITVDGVIRPSEGTSIMLPGTTKIHDFTVPVGQSVTESAVPIDVMSDSFRDFLLTEAVSREKISIVCDAMNLDYDSMVLTENSLQISKIDGNERTTVYMPLNKLVGANAYRLF